MEVTWLPLESNPDVLTKYIHKLGVSEAWGVVDVIGLDSELLEFLPKPVKALILLFPISETYEKHRTEEDVLIRAGQQPDLPKELFYMKQITHNACGTIALVHSLANSTDIDIAEEGVLGKYLSKARGLSVEERGKLLEGDTKFTENHQQLALEGQTDANSDEPVYHHFIALVNSGGNLVELDGRKAFPIHHGPTSEATFVDDAAKVCKEFIARDPADVRFNVLAIAPSMD